MENISTIFINKFHSLEGVTIAKKKKNLYILFNQSATALKANVAELDAVTLALTPNTFLEELFKLEFLIYFKRANELFELLKEGNDIFVSKIVKQEWFFKNFFNNIGVEELIDEVLSNVSYSVRMKILGKLACYQDSETFDNIFDAVTKRYGIFIASKFIYNCTTDKIKETLIAYPNIVIKPAILKMLFRKDSTLILHYFTHTKHSINYCFYDSLVQLIYIENRELFDYLEKKYRLVIMFGRRLTKKFVIEKKEEIIDKPSDYRNLNFKAVLRKLGPESEKLFCNFLPRSFTPYEDYWLLQYFPKKYHYNLHFKTIQSYYNFKFVDRPEMIDEALLNLIPDNSERALYAKIKVDNGDDDYIKYLQVQDSIPRIQEKINITSDISDRSNLIATLVETSFINKDIEALHRVMKYFNFRHKNDDLEVHLKFIRNIENSFGFKQFTEEMWNLLNELLLIHMLKFDKKFNTYRKIQTLPLVKFNRGTSVKQKLSYLNFLINKDFSIDDLLLEYFTVHTDFPHWGSYSKKFEKYFLLFAINNIKLEDKNKSHDFNCNLIKYIDTWNQHYDDDQMSFYDFSSLVVAFNQAIRHDIGWNTAIEKEFRSRIFTIVPNKYRDEYLQVFWDRFQEIFYKNYDHLLWFLRYDIKTFIMKYSTIAEFISKHFQWKQKKLWHVIKKYSHVGLDEIAKVRYLTKIHDDTCLEEKPKFITCLSILMKPVEYIDFANKYKPSKSKLDLENENEVRLYNIQCSIAFNFKHTKCHQVLFSLLNYCADDYFKYSWRSLHSILSKTPENLLPQYLNYLSTKAVSVRKHALYLTCQLSTVKNVEYIVQQLCKSEGDVSLQKILFFRTLKYFIANPNDQLFELIKLNMQFINKTDDKLLRMLARQNLNIPRKYRAAYLHYTWVFLEETVDPRRIKPLKECLLLGLDDATFCKELPLEFLVALIKNNFKCIDGLAGIADFTFTLASARQDDSVIFDAIAQILETSRPYEILLFFRNCYNNLMSLNRDLNFIQVFVQYFEKNIPINDFEEYVKLHFLKIKMGFSPENKKLEMVSLSIYEFIQTLTAEYGVYPLTLFGKHLKEILSLGFTDENISVPDYYYYLVQNFPDTNIALLVTGLIRAPSSLYNKRHYPQQWQIFENTIDVIKQNPDKGVQLLVQQIVNEYLRQ